MFSIHRIICIFLIICIMQPLKAQEKFPGNYFRSPLNIPLYLSGNFAELRSGHFHAGIDIKTGGTGGKKVLASAEGYISRIKIEAAGYGNTIYITHPAGYTTVYGHLDRFRKDISEYVKDFQYKRQQHAVNIFPVKDEWPVKKGEFIAYSGTSGYSLGPHLHFEIRDAATQEPMNVLRFGFEIEDILPPEIFSLYVYPRNGQALVNHSRKKQRFDLEGDNGIYKLRKNDTLKLNGRIGFGLEAYDYLNGAHNRCGLYSVRMFLDGDLKYYWEARKFSFNESRYINSYIDYEEKERNHTTVQKAFIDPNNHLGMYVYSDQDGTLDFSDQKEYRISFILEDAHGNRSAFDFTVLGGQHNPLNDNVQQKESAEIFSCWSPNEFRRKGIEFRIPAGALYDDLEFTFSRSEKLPGTYAPVYYLHDPYTPLHMNCHLSIVPEGIPDSLLEKALIVMVNGDNGIISAGGEYRDGMIQTEIRNLGRYTVMLDTLPPEIKPLDPLENIKNRNAIRFRIRDDLSGIKSYEGYIDSKWALFEYDLKNDLVYYTFDPGRIRRDSYHDLELYITDNKDNISYHYTQFYW